MDDSQVIGVQTGYEMAGSISRRRLISIFRPSTVAVLSAPSFFAAVQEQLGLRLEASRETLDVLVIDRVTKPTPN
jgi:uncharacterized protein (TIGR03435 family)